MALLRKAAWCRCGVAEFSRVDMNISLWSFYFSPSVLKTSEIAEKLPVVLAHIREERANRPEFRVWRFG